MLNHVHLLFSLAKTSRLEKAVGAWKTIPARRINELKCRSGTVWQEDYFDLIIRGVKYFGSCARYIRRSPEKAGLFTRSFTLMETEITREF